MMDLTQLIYTKCFDHDTQMRLLHIAGSSTWLEDLIDYIGELSGILNEDCSKDCDEIEKIEEKFGSFKTEIRDLIVETLEQNESLDFKNDDKKKIYEIASEDIVPKLSEAINNLLNQKIDLHRKVAKIGGIECPIDS